MTSSLLILLASIERFSPFECIEATYISRILGVVVVLLLVVVMMVPS